MKTQMNKLLHLCIARGLSFDYAAKTQSIFIHDPQDDHKTVHYIFMGPEHPDLGERLARAIEIVRNYRRQPQQQEESPAHAAN